MQFTCVKKAQKRSEEIPKTTTPKISSQDNYCTSRLVLTGADIMIHSVNCEGICSLDVELRVGTGLELIFSPLLICFSA